MTDRENWIRAFTFTRPERIPTVFHINAASWPCYGDELEALILKHKKLFPGFAPGSVDWRNMTFAPSARAGIPYTDPWGCVWETSENGIVGTVTKHPLPTWDALPALIPPDPEFSSADGPRNWEKIRQQLDRAKSQGRLADGSISHGFLFLRLIYLRGFENVLFDMMDHAPELDTLISMIEDFNRAVVAKFLAYGVDLMRFPEDLGAQDTPLLSPQLFREHIAPVYRRLIAPVKEAGLLVHMHSDGFILDLVDDLIACGADALNLQDVVNGIDNIAQTLKGRVAIDLDIDRQSVTRFGSPGEIDDLIREAVMKLGAPEGGLSLIYGLYPGTPLRNVNAVMTAMETYADHYG